MIDCCQLSVICPFLCPLQTGGGGPQARGTALPTAAPGRGVEALRTEAAGAQRPPLQGPVCGEGLLGGPLLKIKSLKKKNTERASVPLVSW